MIPARAGWNLEHGIPFAKPPAGREGGNSKTQNSQLKTLYNDVLQNSTSGTTLSYMSTTLTIRLDDELSQSLDQAASNSGRTRSEVVRDALRRQLAISALDEVREQLVPLAEAHGWLTDEDVFRDVS